MTAMWRRLGTHGAAARDSNRCEADDRHALRERQQRVESPRSRRQEAAVGPVSTLQRAASAARWPLVGRFQGRAAGRQHGRRV